MEVLLPPIFSIGQKEKNISNSSDWSSTQYNGFGLVFQVALQEAVCVEEFSTCRALGSVFLRALGRTVAVGVVTRVVEEPEYFIFGTRFLCLVCDLATPSNLLAKYML